MKGIRSSMEHIEIAKKLLSIAYDKYQKNKEQKEAKLEWIISAAFTQACLMEYPSYKILFAEEGEVLFEKIKSILSEINIDDMLLMLRVENIDKFVNQIKSRNLITVTTNQGNESGYDLVSFYSAFKTNIKVEAEKILKGNDTALKNLLVNASIKGVENTEIIIENLKNIKEDLDNVINSKEETKSNFNIGKKIMIRNIKNGTEKIIDQCSSSLDLCEYFDGRICSKEENWQKIKAEIENFTDRLDCNSQYEMHLSVCYSIAYYLGICLNSKTSRKISIIQSSNGLVDWTPQLANDNKKYCEFVVKEEYLDENIDDIAICISVTSDIKEDVTEYLKSKEIKVKKIINFTLDSNTGNKSVENGNHAWNLATQIKNILNKRTLKERGANLYIFIAAPVAIAFFLGQLSFAFVNINLYEYTGILEVDKIYKKSIYISKGERI